jgi:hypothetical protein
MESNSAITELRAEAGVTIPEPVSVLEVHFADQAAAIVDQEGVQPLAILRHPQPVPCFCASGKY